MSRKVLFLLAAIASGLLAERAPGSEAGAPVQRWAVLIGVNDYANAEDLKFCVADQQALRAQLIAAGFPDEQVFVLQDRAEDVKYLPNKTNIERQLELVLGRLVEPNDVVIVAFSGHGMHLDGTSYLCPAEARLDEPQTLVSLDAVYRQVQRCRAGFKLLIVDACRNDPRLQGQRALNARDDARQFAESLIPPQGVVLLNSCTAGEVSWEEKEFGHGVFMHFLLQGLRGEADVDGDGKVTLTELSRHAGQKTKVHVARRFNDSQRPFLKGDLTTEALDFALAAVTRGPARPSGETADLPKKITNSLGMELVLIPAGEFEMGSHEDAVTLLRRFPELSPDHVAGEFPAHQVQITRSFYLGAHEVSLGEFLQFYHGAKYRTECEQDGKGGFGFIPSSEVGWEQRRTFLPWSWGFKDQTYDHPVVNLSWNDAQAFCKWLSEKEGNVFRLPTEAEWEYSCRAGTRTRFWFGDDVEDLPRFTNGADQAYRAMWPNPESIVVGTYESGMLKRTRMPFPFLRGNDRFGFTSPKGSFKPNPFGLYDMDGNVCEWCADRFDSDYYAQSSAQDPVGPARGAARVVRGGHFAALPSKSRAANRSPMGPSERHALLGFRVLREIPAEDPARR